MDTENSLTVVRVEGIGGWLRVKGLSKGKKLRLMGTDNSMVPTREKGVGEIKEEKRDKW